MKYNLKPGLKFDTGLKNTHHASLDRTLWLVCIVISILGIKQIAVGVYNGENFGKLTLVP